MKKSLTLLLLALFCICGFAQTIDPVLLQEMGRRTDDEKIQVVVIMKSQYDRQQLGRRADSYEIRAERRDFVVNELKQFAETSQRDLRTTLNEMERYGMTTAPTTLWMANALCFSATKQAINDLAMRSDVQLIGYDEMRDALFDEESTTANTTRGISNHVTKVNADDVWALDCTGQGVVVAILDSGVNYNHVDLANHLWDGGSEYPNHGYDFVNSDKDPMDDYGHGTHCAGIICGDGTAGTQTGIAPNATLMCLKVLNASGNGSVSITCYAIEWAVEHGCDVLNLAFGWSNSSIAERTLLRNTCVSALNAGVIASVAAGDRGYSTSSYPIPNNITVPGSCPPPYMDSIQESNPGGLSCAFTVGAVDNYDYISSSSSRGPVTWSNTEFGDYPYSANSTTEFGLIRPDVCAPGYNVVSTSHNNTTGYSEMSGTAMAASCVSGCISLLLSKNINATPAEICEVFEKTAYSRASGKTNTYGYGRVDVLAAVNDMAAGPLSVVNVGINDMIGGNIDGKLNPGESVYLHLTLKNDSGTALNGVNLTLSTESEYVTITDGTETLTNINPGQTKIFQNIFNITLSEDAPVAEPIWFAAEASLNGESLEILRFSVMVYGHVLVFNQVTITSDSNGNGSLEAGETGTLHVVISNTGNEEAPYINGSLSSTFPHLIVNSTAQDFGTIPVNGQGSADFSVSLASTSPDSYTIDLTLDLLDGYDKHTFVDFEIWRMAIVATSEPEGAGILTGGGNYGAGQSCTLTATPSNSNYVFSNWTKNGEVIRHYPSFTFNVTEGAEYVAHFKPVDGVAIGDPTSSSSSLPSDVYYKYSMSQQIYTKSEMGEQPRNIANVSFYNTYYGTTRNLTIYMVHTNKEVFNSNYDWIQVTEADKVFSGSVSFTSRGWTTIYFNTPFNYNGTSNVVLVVDDNTNSNSYSSNSMRTFNANENQQALYIYSDNIDYIPNNYYSGTRWKYKNQVIFGNAHYDYTVTATCNPADSGTPNGYSESHYYGQPITFTATPNPGYVFNYWIKNNNTTNPTYYPNISFTVTESVDYVANFQQMEGVAVGVPTTSSTYLPFYNSYTYHSLTQQIYTAAEMGGQSRQFNSLSFYNNNGSNIVRDSIDVYLVHTSKSSFENTTDWITVTEADRVFSGRVTGSKGWISIFFDDLFQYNGTSNLAVIIASNASGNGYVGFRAFPTTSNNQNISQAIHVLSNSVFYDPLNPTSYTGSLDNVKNEIVFGIPSGSYTVTVTANPPEGGTVSGGGSNYYQGQSCTVTATPNEGYVFNNWKVNGTVVSTAATYTFPVQGDMTLEASFGEPIMVNVSVNPEESGIVTGAGGYASGQTCTLTATANPGYAFRYWTRNGSSASCLSTYSFNVSSYYSGNFVAYFKQLNENDVVVGDPISTNSYLPTYMNSKYSLTQQIYTADELGGPGEIASVSFFNATGNYPTRDVVIYLVQTNKTAFDNANDWIAVTESDIVYSGSFKPSYYNWSTIYFNEPFIYNGTSNLALVVYDKTESNVSALSFRTFDAEGTQAIGAYSSNPFDLSGPTNTGSLYSVKNQIILGAPVYGYSLALSVDPANAGSVSGPIGGHFYGQPVTITATPNPGYVFKSWTKRNNTNVVSYLSPATLSITDNVEYVAHFVAMEGIAVGEPNHTNSDLPIKINSYNYSLSQQIYTAEELNTNSCQISSVSFFNTGYSPTRDLTVYMVNTTKAAYDNLSDWISVTDDDIVFDGSVNINGGNWTTIYFNTPFIYDGTSNVALMVYDHTASYSSDLYFRTFSTTTNQAICANDAYAINPTNPIVVSTLLSEKNHVVFGVADYDYTMTLSADPEEGGSVSVNNEGLNGYYYYGQPLTISAIPNQGYVFNNWTKSYVNNNGNTQNTTVSYLSTSDISLTETADYTAHFQQMDGIIIGEAAKTNECFPFNTYYSLTQQIYTAEELNSNPCQLSSVSFFNTGNSMNRELDIYMVNTTKNEFDSNSDWLSVTEADLVFSGNVYVSGYGWTTIFFSTPFNYTGSNVALIINTKTSQYYGYDYRTFDTDETYQAICASRSGTGNNFDPTNPSQYSGNRYTEKNQIVFGVVSYDYPVTVSANPTEGGTASIIGNNVNGKYYYGQPISLAAAANTDYAFSTWTKGNENVSCFPVHNLSVTDSTEYVANFKQVGNDILIGEPSHAESHLPSYYNTSLTQQIYTASEMGGTECDISSISFFSAGTSTSYRYNVDIYMVNTDKTSFDSITDWIPVPQNTEALYSGRVTFSAKNWVTVYFPTPFHYNGTSNVALIIRDNTKTYSTNVSCRTFDTDTTQVLRIYSGNNTVYDPYAPTGNGTLLSVKNQVIFGRANYNCYIIGSANPTNGGWVSGDWGAHYYGQPFTFTASPMPGYVFTNIEKNGVVVSHVPTYSFTVTESATFVANFKQVDGVAIGQPETTNYTYLPYHSYYSLTQQIYTTTELGTTSRDISSVSFYNTGNSSGTRNQLDVYMLYTDKMTFDSTTDWIAVTENDKVFSGSVNVLANDWTTINFNKVFNYDGSSNVVLVVDNSFGNYNYNSLYGRTFSTNGNQAIRVYGSNTNYDPSNPSYTGTLLSVKNQVIFGPPSCIYSVTASANPEEGGTVSGGGENYFLGQSCTLTATANEGYSFYNWTENGTVVSLDATYTFAVTGDMHLVANFGEPIMITATSDPEGGGTITGGGSYGMNHSCTLTATSNPGYVFTKWTYRKNNSTYSSYFSTYTFDVTEANQYTAHFDQVNNGIAIGDGTYSNNYLPNYATYPYALTQQIYTHDELGNEAHDISSLTFMPLGYSRTRNVTVYLVHTDKTAFADGTDWIPVTENDMVFSGEVYYSSSNWTTIYFTIPFSYNGSSNLALVVDDNTGTSFNWINYGRTFGTDENQAIRIYGSNTNYDPYNPSGYSGTVMSEKNQVIFGFTSYDYSVTLTANPPEGGTVSGGGNDFYLGQPCTVTATPNAGYCFYYWKKNNTIVSKDETYTFQVIEDTELEATFGPPAHITVTATPAAGGVVTGAGEYAATHTCTLTATPNPGYVFVKWMKTGNNNPVSYFSTYSFTIPDNNQNHDADYVAVFEWAYPDVVIGNAETVSYELPTYYYYSLSEQIYTAEEIGMSGEIQSLSFFNADSYGETNRSFTIYMKHTDNSDFDSYNDWIPVTAADQVFNGTVNVVYGDWTEIVLDTPFQYNGASNLMIAVDDNTGDYGEFYFRAFNTENYQSIYVYDYETDFEPSNLTNYWGNRYKRKNQIKLGFDIPTLTQTINLTQGWNWFSTNVEITLDDLKAALIEALPGSSSIAIKSKGNGTTNYNGSTWRGQLSALDVTQMYRISVPNACEITLEGFAINPLIRPVIIRANAANWIGFPFGESMSVSDAFAGFAVSGDQVKGKNGYTTFNGTIWRGNLDTLVPGQGYIYKSNANEDRTFVFPTNSQR